MDGAVVFDDLIRGRVVVSNDELDDLIIRRTDGSPTYNLTVVVDDADMEITHVIRGDDHLSNTPRQINILKALGKEPPKYAHVPMILGEDGARLSKRHGAVSVMQYMHDGYLPEALLNYLVRLGWSHGDQEVFSLDEMIQLFDLEAVNRAPSAFNVDKLRWLNQQHIKDSDPLRVAHLLGRHLGDLGIDPAEGPDIVQVVEAQRERASTLVELAGISLSITAISKKSIRKRRKRPSRRELMMSWRQLRQNWEAWQNGGGRRCTPPWRKRYRNWMWVSARWRCRCAWRLREAHPRRILTSHSTWWAVKPPCDASNALSSRSGLQPPDECRQRTLFTYGGNHERRRNLRTEQLHPSDHRSGSGVGEAHPNRNTFSAGAERLSPYRPCEIHRVEFRHRPGL